MILRRISRNDRKYLLRLDVQFQFRIAKALTVKPNLAPDDPGRVQASNPFARDGPEFNLGNVGPSHTLILNKFCVVRPQFVLHTNTFEPQSDFLNAQDLDAAWQVLSRLGPSYIAIYNCGVEAGSSLGHKHLQLIPRPSAESHELFPDKYKYDTGKIRVVFYHSGIYPGSKMLADSCLSGQTLLQSLRFHSNMPFMASRATITATVLQ